MADRTKKKPPADLPKEFLEIWKALSKADRDAPNRQALAARLGLSTATLQRILVRGDVPRFRKGARTREVRAWARTITRLAHHLGGEPKAWIEKVGIPWDDATREASASALVAARGGDTTSRPRRTRDAAAEVTDLFGRPAGEPIRVGVRESGPLAAALPGFGASFFEVWTRRLLAAVEPSRTVLFRSEEDPRPGGDIDLAAGVPLVVSDRRSDRSHIAIPGWRLRLSAGSLVPEDARADLPFWTDVSRAGAADLLVTVEGSPAHRFLRGQCHVPAERIMARKAKGVDALARDLFEETGRWRGRRVVLLADEETLHRVADAVRRLEESAGRYTLHELPDAPHSCPSYPLGLSYPRDPNGVTEDLLLAARDEELLRNSARETARLHGEAMAEVGSASRRRMTASSRGASGALERSPLWKPTTLEIPGEAEFARHACHDMLNALSTMLEGPEEHARALAIQLAAMVAPEEWKDAVRQAAARSEAPLCQSCSVSLFENGGVSDRYCRYCADEKGELRPREEVTRILADWMRGWQGDMDAEEALRRAKRFMSVMPAWATN